jgi:hypothetical protein
MFWALGQIILSLVMSLTTSWRLISFGLLGIPFFVSAFFFKFVKDSPRYLVHLKQFGMAKISIQNMAKINERPMGDWVLSEESIHLMGQGPSPNQEDNGTLLETDKSETTKSRTVMTLFKYPSLKMANWSLLAIFVVLSVPHQGNLLAFTHFSDNGPQSWLTCGIIELFSYIVSAYCVLNFRRKMIMKTSFVIVGAVYILFFFAGARANDVDIHHSAGIAILLLIIGRIATCIGYGTLLIYITEVVPTSIRHLAYGLFTAVGAFAMIFLDNFVQSMRSNGFSPQFWVGCIVIALWFTITYLPETFNKPLLEEIKEEDEFQMF